MANQYTSEKKTIGELLSLTSPTIRVPEWQRDYSWDSDQIETFWQDLIRFSNQYPEKTILSQEYFLGSIVLVSQQANQLLLDGQQRLATATILLSVIRDKLSEYKGDAATRIEHKYIKEIDDATGRELYKLTLNRFDNDFFRAAIQSHGGTTAPHSDRRSHQLIAKARDYFRAQFDKQYAELGDGKKSYEWSLRIRQVLTDHMSVVSVVSTDEDNAATVFETLNDRGIGLSTPDLLRNLLLRRATSGSEEEIINNWQSIYGIEEKDVRVDEFLRHYWLSVQGDVKTRSLYREMKLNIEQRSINSLEFSKELANAAGIYHNIVSGTNENREIERLLEDIKALGAKSIYPALLSCFSIGISEEDILKLLKSLIVLYVRHIVIGNRESTVLERIVYQIAKDLRKTNSIESSVKMIAAATPSDAEFITQFNRVVIRRLASARYVLRELEHYKRITGEVAVETPDRVHIEHIYPQNPAAANRWANHDQYINRLGNLTLLSRVLNESLRNEVFINKKGSYEKSDFLLTKELLEYTAWDPKGVDSRQEKLGKDALNIWSLPT